MAALAATARARLTLVGEVTSRLHVLTLRADGTEAECSAAIERLLGEGIRVSGTMHPGVLRAVTHLGITDEDVEQAVEAIPRGLGVQRSPATKNASAAST